MSTQIQRRRGTTAQHASFTGVVGETTVDTDKDTVVVHDGTTVGGHPLMRENGSNSALALGSAGTPSLKFTGDTNTGIYSPGADQVAISTGGSGRLFVDASGNASLGTTPNVNKRFLVSSPATGTATRSNSLLRIQSEDTGRDVHIQFSDNITNATEIGMVAGAQYFCTAGLERLRITSTGLVGVGTSSPGAILHTSQTSSGSSVIGAAIRNNALAASTGVILDLSPSDLSPGVRSAQIEATNNGSNQINLAFKTSNGDVPATRMTLDYLGRVGIGTSSPVDTLHVVGSARFGDGTNFAGVSASASGSAFEAAAGSANLLFKTGGTTRAVIDSSGRLGIGTTSPAATLDAVAESTNGFGVRIRGRASDGFGALQFTSNDGSSQTASLGVASNTLVISTASSERARIDSSGRLLVGTSSARSDFFNTSGRAPAFQIEGTSTNAFGMSITANANSDNGAEINLAKSRGTNTGSSTVVANGDTLARISFQGADGLELVPAAYIQADVDGTPGANDMPGRLVFSTTADGASSPTERMRIDNNGRVKIKMGNYDDNTVYSNSFNGGVVIGASSGTLVQMAAINDAALNINRLSSDGDLVQFNQAGTNEGSISVSGTTVSYNGAHLSRWSQLPGGAERTEILRGSVLSNIDEMCDWPNEENEQLNRMKVSDVEGDKNVSGVFQAWDDDDDTYTNDFYCAMTGDFIIRIAEGVTVERGDLLMSAGDGTAKPQDDDIIRSKTIAKVTSTNVSCTYEDGSYCVPCVLMAC